MPNTPLISIVSPVYRAEKIVALLVQKIIESVKTITENYEIILVEDGSKDNSWAEIEMECTKNEQVKGIKLSRNFGQHYAITAGIDATNSEWVVVMDCDLQDEPTEIPRLYKKAQEGFEIVLARRETRQDNFLKKLGSKLFYWVFSYLTGTKQDGTVANFGIYHRKAIDEIKKMREPMRAFPPMVNWVGFRKTALNVQHNKREEGTSTYSWSKLTNLALDMTLAYSDRPLKLAIKLGFFISLSAFLLAIYFIFAYYLGIITVSGYASLIFSIWFLAGLTIFILGVVGLYIGKSFDGVKNRPLYIVDKKLN